MGDALTVEKTLEKCGLQMPQFDIIFADPPYGIEQKEFEKLIELVKYVNLSMDAKGGELIIKTKNPNQNVLIYIYYRFRNSNV